MTSFDICPICLEEMTQNNRILLLCKHWFHEICINQWWQKSLSCPYCRKSCVNGNEDVITINFLIDRLIIKRLCCYGPAIFDEIIDWIKNNDDFKVKYINSQQLQTIIPERIDSLLERGYMRFINKKYEYQV